jgi:hypothetical protein
VHKKKYSHYEVGYIKLRNGISFLGLIFPFIFLASSGLRPGPLKGSISAYYHVDNLERNLFVGILITVGVFLILYEGYSKREDWTLTLSGICVVFVALIPTAIEGKNFTWHEVFAIIFFVGIFIVMFFFSNETLSKIKDPKRKEKYRKIYQLIAILMIICIIIALIFKIILDAQGKEHTAIFWLEAGGIWLFALFWLVKTREVNPNIPLKPIERNKYFLDFENNKANDTKGVNLENLESLIRY